MATRKYLVVAEWHNGDAVSGGRDIHQGLEDSGTTRNKIAPRPSRASSTVRSQFICPNHSRMYL